MQTCFFLQSMLSCAILRICISCFQNSLSIRWRCNKYRWLLFPKCIGNLKIAGRGTKIINYLETLKMGCQFHRGLFLRFGDNVVEMEGAGAGAGVGNLIYLLTGIESTSRTIREHNASNAVHILHTCI